MIEVSNRHNVKVKLILDLRTGTKEERPIKIGVQSPDQNRPSVISDGLPSFNRVSPRMYKELLNLKKQSPLNVFNEAIERCNSIINEMHSFDLENLRRTMSGKDSFEAENEIAILIKKKIRQMDQDGKNSEAFKTLNSALLKRWNMMPQFKDITSDSLKAWQVDFLEIPQKNGKLRTISTFNTYMRSLKTIFLMGQREGLTTLSQYPFGTHAYVIKNNETRYMTVPLDCMKFIETYEYPEGRDFENFTYYKELFLLIFYMGGINLGDLFRLKWKQYDQINGVMSWGRNKTKSKSDQTMITCPIPTKAKEIIAKYCEKGEANDFIFSEFKPYVSEKQINVRRDEISKRVNKRVKAICQEFGFKRSEEVTCYTARHTWATFARDNGFTAEQIQKMLGHESILTTMRYLGSLDKDTIDSMRDMIEKFNQLSKQA